ncbi:hypothetical protein HQ865_04840 [Mucilaginibacter mali]|uniref:Uncharacterized protein n=1 Tax=Mucilaginibacter mali TaxID=2740462 RepID=A0A7D4Q1Q3_9SPHI|nr:hypothetical protein [Mucilaginibacter mali]QKJ29107.1 hypothetical protein HQ865_04840 [Mucilaginibacter mali]
MGYIKEPKGVDFIVAPSVLTTIDSNAIHQAIANYKKERQVQALNVQQTLVSLSAVKKTFRNRKNDTKQPNI